jgi:hypothetical protein
MAQVVEHLPSKLEALSSNPISHTHTKILLRRQWAHKFKATLSQKKENSQVPVAYACNPSY